MTGDLPSGVTLAAGVEQSILQYVKKEGLVPGSPLPKEEEFAAGLNVSRHIVREGLASLKALGVIESRKHKGMFVRHRLNAFESVRKLFAAQLFNSKERHQFMQLRIIMEMGMTRYIWKNKQPQDLAQLRQIIKTESLSIIQRETEFHVKLFAIGGNDIANQFQYILASALSGIGKISHDEDEWQKSHLQICSVLETGTPDDFAETMEKHFIPYT